MNQDWFVYIVKCKDGALYTGITTDLVKRVKKHNSGKGSKSVVAHGLPCKLVYSLYAASKSFACRYERRIKAMSRGMKLELISNHHNYDLR